MEPLKAAMGLDYGVRFGLRGQEHRLGNVEPRQVWVCCRRRAPEARGRRTRAGLGTWGAAGASARRQDGDRLVRMYLLTNDKESKLGKTPLPDGMVRVFRHNGREGLSFLVAQQIKYVPIGDKIELNLGADLEVIFELVKLRAWRDNLWM